MSGQFVVPEVHESQPSFGFGPKIERVSIGIGEHDVWLRERNRKIAAGETAGIGGVGSRTC